jgi:hypothetical protein
MVFEILWQKSISREIGIVLANMQKLGFFSGLLEWYHFRGASFNLSLIPWVFSIKQVA